MKNLRPQVGSISIVGPAARSLSRSIQGYLKQPTEFSSSETYWESRYNEGGNSGPGSYGRLAAFKAETINSFIALHSIASAIEFGCGDGSQLLLANYPNYIGVDVSKRAVELCRTKFEKDSSKKFFVIDEFDRDPTTAEMSMSLDVIYHLVEERIYRDYMRRLARSAERFICIYSSNAQIPGHVDHIRHRRFTDWISSDAPEWKLIQTVRNQYPYDFENPDETSWADFYFFAR
jgi:SAM-dependent methyltransferase